MTYTEPQRRALAWLTPEWQNATRPVSAALDSLWTYHRAMVEREAYSGPRGGWRVRWRLTPAGVAAKAAPGA